VKSRKEEKQFACGDTNNAGRVVIAEVPILFATEKNPDND